MKDIDTPGDGTNESGFVRGYSTALHEFETREHPEYRNPFREGSDEHRGYEEGVYDFTQK